MLLIDYNQTHISSIMGYLGTNSSIEVDENLIRHLVLSTILSHKQKFGDYGKIVLCADDRNYWRKGIFPYYKSGRKKARDDSKYDWKLIFNSLNMVRDEIKAIFPYTVILADGAEADDAIATIVIRTAEEAPMMGEPEPILIVSSDKDFLQLQKYGNVRQYSPMQQKFLVSDNPDKYLREHIIRGDSGDGVPNFLSPDDVFVMSGVRQKSIMQKNLDVWLSKERPEDFCDDTMLRNYKRNEQLIDLSLIPKEVGDRIMEQYNSGPQGQRQHLFGYFIQKGLKNLMEHISDF